jgi:zinc finger BED domain-containing protein 5/7/8/9
MEGFRRKHTKTTCFCMFSVSFFFVVVPEVMIGDKAKQIFDRVPLSKNTVHRRIIDMSNNVKQMLLSVIFQSRYYALQVDESTDIANFANLMAFVRYEKDQEIHDDFLFCQPLSRHTTGEDIFNVIYAREQN